MPLSKVIIISRLSTLHFLREFDYCYSVFHRLFAKRLTWRCWSDYCEPPIALEYNLKSLHVNIQTLCPYPSYLHWSRKHDLFIVAAFSFFQTPSSNKNFANITPISPHLKKNLKRKKIVNYILDHLFYLKRIVDIFVNAQFSKQWSLCQCPNDLCCWQ